MTHETTQKPAFTNRLVNETSPYLLQHAHNPVDWHPWSDEALKRAKEEDKPIFLSIGYAACHWCHVMAHESFEDEETAEMMNEHFINVKVDREERPDLDDIYMRSVQILRNQGGWPMSVFLTPDLKPFYAGTYFPPRNYQNMPSFQNVVQSIAKAWRDRRGEIVDNADKVAEIIGESMNRQTAEPAPCGAPMIDKAVEAFKQNYDGNHGGFGGAPKFPPSATLQLLLRHYDRAGDQEALDMAVHTLRAMAFGGMYDQAGGGFHRYSVDAQWLVPHFEKMLYDNGQLCEVYLEAWQLTGDWLFARVAREIIEYQLRDMTHEQGGFYSSEDADSEGEEGKFYLWTHDALMELLGPEDGEFYCAYYSVRPEGNFASPEPYHDDKNILHVRMAPETFAKERGLSVEELMERIDALNEKVLAERSKRVRPGLDDKILTAWNGYMIHAMALAGRVLDEPRYTGAAVRAAEFIWTHLRKDGGLLRSCRGGEVRYDGYLDDYAAFANSLATLYETTFTGTWLERAREIADRMIEVFWDKENGAFFYTRADDPTLLVRPKPGFDGSEPSGNSMAALLLLRLAGLTGESRYRERAETVLAVNHANLNSIPEALPKMLCAVDFWLRPPKEIAVFGPKDEEDTQALLREVWTRFLPNKIVAGGSGDGAGEAQHAPLLEGKGVINGQPAAYVCRNYACTAPVTTPEALAHQLDAD